MNSIRYSGARVLSCVVVYDKAGALVVTCFQVRLGAKQSLNGILMIPTFSQ